MNDSEFSSLILSALKARFQFKDVSGKWLQRGQCPDCLKWEAYCAAENPKVVKCSRADKCGWESSVRDELPDLFEDWSKRFEVTEKEPNAAADAYLRQARGLDLTGLRGAFTQEYYKDQARDIGSATVRFALPNDCWWERIIDRPGRFDKKARFKFGASYAGHWWQHPADSFEELATKDEIWVEEGIFDCCALRQHFPAPDPKNGIARRGAVSVMSTSNYPEHALGALREAALAKGIKTLPHLVFAYDVGKAGVSAARKHVERARREGWSASAAQVRPDGEGTKLDWNDLALRHQEWKGEAIKAPLGEEMLKFYRWCGDVTLAATKEEKAQLIHENTGRHRFEFRFNNHIYWAEGKFDAENNITLRIEELANCAFRILYRERDEAADESNYFIQIDFPGNQPTAKARFSAACCAASGEFKKRLFAFAGMWSGSQEQLDRLMRGQTRTVKTVEPLHFTGYSAPHKAWILGDLAVRQGRVVKINAEGCFDFGKQAVKLRGAENLLEITWDEDKHNFNWVEDVWAAWGSRGLVVLAFFTMSLFAQQIRDEQESLGFLEIVGEPGSGKSTLVTFMWKLLGRRKYEGFDPNKWSVAALARNFQKVANLPVGLIEGNRNEGERKPIHARQFDWAELLTLFNGRSPRGTGVKNNGTDTFEPPFLGSVYLMQNTPIDAMDAVLERLMSFRIDKSSWSDTSKAAAQRLHKLPIEQASAYIVHVTTQADKWLDFYFKRFRHHDDGAMARRVDGLHNNRCIHNHSQLAASVEALGHLLPVKPEWIAETLKLVDWMALDRQQSSGADHPMVKRFWDQFDYIQSLESDDDGKAPVRPINLSRRPEQYIAVNLPHFEERSRARGLQPIPTDQLHKLLRGSKSRKFVATKQVNCVDGPTRSCWVFEQVKRSGGPGPDDVL